MLRTLRRGQLAFDIVAPLGIFALLVIPYSMIFTNLIILIGMCAALAFWRLNSGISLGIAWITAIIEMALGLTPDPSNIAIFIVVYATSAYGNRLVKWLGFASTFVGAAAIALYVIVLPVVTVDLPPPPDDATFRSAIIAFFSFLALFVLSWTLGLLTKTFSAARESRRAQSAAEAERQSARRDVMIEQERTRIARDMHDIVAHSLAVVIAQADGARYARQTDPAAVDAALLTISSTARDALGDVRVLLGQLRHSQVAGPQPVLDDLDRLLEQMRGSGLPVEYRESGARGSPGTNLQMAIYRIVQEALTNALRHGDTRSAVALSVAWDASGVAVRIENATGDRGSSEIRQGHGVSGMRERAVLNGGHLDIDHHDGRFLVFATLPRSVVQTGAIPTIAVESVS